MVAQARVELALMLEQQDGLQDGWLGRELARQLGRTDRKWKRHLERWDRFKDRFGKKFVPRFGRRVLECDIFTDIVAWELWYSGWPNSPEIHNWISKLPNADRLEIMQESRSAGKRVRLVVHIASLGYLDKKNNQ